MVQMRPVAARDALHSAVRSRRAPARRACASPPPSRPSRPPSHLQALRLESEGQTEIIPVEAIDECLAYMAQRNLIALETEAREPLQSRSKPFASYNVGEDQGASGHGLGCRWDLNGI